MKLTAACRLVACCCWLLVAEFFKNRNSVERKMPERPVSNLLTLVPEDRVGWRERPRHGHIHRVGTPSVQLD